MNLSDIIDNHEPAIKERIDYIFDSFQKDFPNIRYDERTSIVGIGEPKNHLLCYFRKNADGVILVKFKAAESAISLLTEISEITNYIQKTVEMFHTNDFSIKPKQNRQKRESKKREKREIVPASPLARCELVVQTQQTPGVVLFENYEQLKTNINAAVSYYLGFEYTLENYKTASKHYKELKAAKNVLEKTKKEIINGYNAPLDLVKEKIDELISIIKEPLKRVDAFIKENKTKTKKHDIYIFSKDLAVSYGLQEHMDKIFRSPAFFDIRWLNVSCSSKKWQEEITKKIENAARDINYILSMENENKAIILAQYYQTLSMGQVEDFILTINQASSVLGKKTAPNASQVFDLKMPDGQATCISGGIIQNMTLKDFEILKHIANSINPYTGEIITGIDESLKSKLKQIADKIEAWEFEEFDGNSN